MTDFADATGTRIAFDSEGQGPDVVFLHAGIADRTMWAPQVEALSGRFRCTTVDLRGFGESALGDEPFSRRDDLAAVLDAVGAESASLVGCSIGAGFALDFAIERPERVDKLVLVGVTPAGWDGDDDPALANMWPVVDAAIERGDLEEAGKLEARMWVDGPHRGPDDTRAWLRDKVVEWSVPINSVTDWGESLQLDPLAWLRLDEVRAPTLVVVGDQDYGVVLAGSRDTAAGIDGARLEAIADAAHLPNLEHPAEFNRLLGEFLDSSET